MTHAIFLSSDQSLSIGARWASSELVYRPVTELHHIAPLRLTVPAHGVPDKWSVRVTRDKPEWEQGDGVIAAGQATVIDADTLEINAVNAAGWHRRRSCHEEHVTLVYQKPIEMDGMTITAKAREPGSGKALLNVLEGDGLTVDVAGCFIGVVLSPEQMDALCPRPGHHHHHTPRKFILDIDAVDTGGTSFHILKTEVVRERY